MAMNTANISERLHTVARGFVLHDPALEKQLRALTRPRTGMSILAHLQDWVLIVGAAVCSWYAFATAGLTLLTGTFYVSMALLIASRQRGLENLIHEASHRNLSQNRRLNDALCLCLAGLYLHPGLDLKTQWQSHVVGHHGYFWDPVRDPDFAGYHTHDLDRFPLTSLLRSLEIITRGVLRSIIWQLHSLATLKFLPNLMHDRRFAFRVVMLTVGITVCSIWGLAIPLLLYWFVPYLFLLPVIRFVGHMSEHAGLGCETEFAATRNHLGLWQRYFIHPHGDCYHIVHHLYPRIPHHSLGVAHRLLMQDPAYARGNHCYGLIAAWRGRRATLSDLLRGSFTIVEHSAQS
jgi:fatty acid desaturase